ncbi:MAG: WG repeat-containing protein [Waterburya sp.]
MLKFYFKIASILSVFTFFILNNSLKISYNPLKTVQKVQAKSIETNLFPVMSKGKLGFVDINGNLIIPKIFNCENYLFRPIEQQFYEGLALVCHNNLYGFINKKGEFVIPPKFDFVNPFSEGLAPVKKDGKWGYIDKKGDILVQPIYDEVKPFSEGLAVVKMGDKRGYLDRSTLKIAVNIVLDDASSFSEGLAFVKYQGEKYYMNKKTEPIYFLPKGCDGYKYSDKLARISCWDKPYLMSLDFIDTNGKGYNYFPIEKLPVHDFTEGLAPFIMYGLYGFIDKKGNIVIEPRFEEVENFRGGLAMAELEDGRSVYINKKGNIVWENVFTR